MRSLPHTHLNKVLRGIKRLHQMDIAHRNIRLESIAARLDEEEGLVAKLTRFSLASQLDRSEVVVSILSLHAVTESKGLASYRAPEMAEEKGYTVKVDMWAVGVLTYLCCAGYPPFEGDDDEETLVRPFLSSLLPNRKI